MLTLRPIVKFWHLVGRLWLRRYSGSSRIGRRIPTLLLSTCWRALGQDTEQVRYLNTNLRCLHFVLVFSFHATFPFLLHFRRKCFVINYKTQQFIQVLLKRSINQWVEWQKINWQLFWLSFKLVPVSRMWGFAAFLFIYFNNLHLF